MIALNGLSVEAGRREAAARLKLAEIETPELDARLLVGAVLDLDHTALSVQASKIITRDEADTIKEYVARRMAHEPVARILGVKEFWGLNLMLSPATLIPRPDTETVVSAALEFLRQQDRLIAEIHIADIGTGSGAILLALLSECPDALGVGTDISADAIKVANANARNLGFADRVTFVTSNYAAALSGAFDLIVSNPPYIPTDDIAKLEIDVRDHDPHLALDGGNDGLDAYRMIAPQAAQLLLPGGALIVEVGYDQAASVTKIMDSAGLAVQTPPRTDLAGIQRVVLGQKASY